MKTMGVKELKKRLSEVLREVEDTGQVIGVSNRGRVVTRLVPMHAARASKHDPRATIADIDALAAAISDGVPADVSVDDAINDIRR